MKIFAYVIGVFWAATSTALMAHVEGHGEPPRVATCKHVAKCTKQEVVRGGLDVIAMLVKNGKLHKSWSEVKTSSSTKNEDGYWIVGYSNPKEADKTKQTFYLYVSEDGLLEGASFTAQ